MFNKSLQYSVTAQKNARFRALRIVLLVFALFVLYNVIQALFFSVWVVQGDAMHPGLQRGDRLLVVSAALPKLFAMARGRELSYGRGDIVIVDTSRAVGRNVFATIADGFVRFVTAQRVGVARGAGSVYARRLVALPGDEASMANFVMRVRPAGSAFALTEFELAARPYSPTIPQVPALWDLSLPFSGEMESVPLRAGEFFAAADDRSSTSDSRAWGPVSSREIVGRPVFRFWPPSRIGRP
ncbi:MAG: signal peptidase I [Treponema sp.]|nr:signal peptidase I [Treponema sp.]